MIIIAKHISNHDFFPCTIFLSLTCIAPAPKPPLHSGCPPPRPRGSHQPFACSYAYQIYGDESDDAIENEKALYWTLTYLPATFQSFLAMMRRVTLQSTSTSLKGRQNSKRISFSFMANGCCLPQQPCHVANAG
jgi:hypothetical protein